MTTVVRPITKKRDDGGGIVKNNQKVRDVIYEHPLSCIWFWLVRNQPFVIFFCTGADIIKVSGEFEIGSQYHFSMETQSVIVRPVEDLQVRDPSKNTCEGELT